jgi:hypothetical protein
MNHINFTTAKQLPGEPGGKIMIATDGVEFEIIFPKEYDGFPWRSYRVPEWAKLFWFLKDDPRGRPDWNGTNRQDFTKPNKMSKSEGA